MNCELINIYSRRLAYNTFARVGWSDSAAMVAQKEAPKRATFEEAVSLTGYGTFNILILLASGGSLMVVIIETMAMMFIAPASQCDLELDLTTKGVLAAISFLGVVSSSHLWGFIADTKGRRNVLIVSMLASFVTSLASSIIPQAWLFILVRYINGFFVGGASAVVYAYAGEFHDKVYRPKVVSWIATFVAFGNMIIPGFAWLILPLDFAYNVPVLDVVFRPWRLLVICYGLPALVFAVWLMTLPESPKYLLAQGRGEEALKILKDMYAMNSGKDRDDFPVVELAFDEDGEVSKGEKVGLMRRMWNQTVPLFKSPYLLKTFMVCLLQFGAFSTSSGLLMWYPEILNRMTEFSENGIGAPVSLCGAIDHYNNMQSLMQNSTIEDIGVCVDSIAVDVYQISLLIGATFAVLYIVSGTVINVVGAKRLVVFVLVVTTACGLAAQNVDGLTTSTVLMCVFLTEAVCVGILNAIVVELFPTQLRAMALAISLMAGRFGAVTGSKSVGPLVYDYCGYTFYVFGIVHLVLVVTIFLLPSPSNSKKLIEPVV